MSGAFVKEEDDPGPEADNRPEPEDHHMTAKGYADLQKRIEAMSASLAATPESDDPSRMLEHERLKRDLHYAQRVAERAQVVPREDQVADRVGFGAQVTIWTEPDGSREILLVGVHEADPELGRINWDSPLGHALAGARVGDTVVWRRPAGPLEVEVERIVYP